METKQEEKLSNQAIGAIMLALQKGIMEGVDITSLMQGFVLESSNSGLVIKNPPTFKLETEDQTTTGKGPKIA